LHRFERVEECDTLLADSWLWVACVADAVAVGVDGRLGEVGTRIACIVEPVAIFVVNEGAASDVGAERIGGAARVDGAVVAAAESQATAPRGQQDERTKEAGHHLDRRTKPVRVTSRLPRRQRQVLRPIVRACALRAP
jgi:hypothetical protein